MQASKWAILLLLLFRISYLFGQADMKGRPGIEVNTNFNFGRKDNADLGINCMFTSAYTKNKGMDLRDIYLFGVYFGMFQFGPSITFNPIKIDGQRAWRATAGITYNQLADFHGVHGLSLRVRAITVLNKDRILLDNVGLKTELGLTSFGVITLYYGYTIPIKDYGPYPFREHALTLTFNLNTSILAYGFQGM
jgi:hypothetical protein